MVIDNSLVRPWLDRVYFKPLIQFIPRFISPNSITISGLVACLSMLPMLAYWEAPRAMLALACGLAVHYYTLTDQLDGMQARRLNRTTDFGAFLDHACDFTNGQIIIWASFQLVDMSWYWLVAASSAYTITFLTSHFEDRTSGTLHFGAIGPLEALLVATVFLLTYSVAPEVWMTPLVAQFTGGHALIIFYLVGFGWNSLSVYLRLRSVFLPTCGIPILAICLAGAASLWSSTAAPVFWLIQLSCGSIYGLYALCGPSVAVRFLPVFPIGLLSVFVAMLAETGLIDASTAATAAYLILGYSLLVLLAVAVDVRRFFVSVPLGAAAALQPQSRDH
jgi:phosphatidylglycerophosphate synthase